MWKVNLSLRIDFERCHLPKRVSRKTVGDAAKLAILKLFPLIFRQKIASHTPIGTRKRLRFVRNAIDSHQYVQSHNKSMGDCSVHKQIRRQIHFSSRLNMRLLGAQGTWLMSAHQFVRRRKTTKWPMSRCQASQKHFPRSHRLGTDVCNELMTFTR